MTIALVAAMDRNRLIGADGNLPWHLPADMRHFRRLTLGKTVLMGRLTWESLGRPLPERQNLVLTRQLIEFEGAQRVGDLEQAMAACTGLELMVIGGAQIYKLALPMAERIYLTEVDAALEGDTWFPEIPPRQWREVERQSQPADEKNCFGMSFVTLQRR